MNTLLTRLSAELIEQYEAEGFWQGDTIYALVRWHAEHTPQAFAVRDRYRRLTYAQLLAATDALAADLARYDVRPGQRVGVWLPSRSSAANSSRRASSRRRPRRSNMATSCAARLRNGRH